jgi:hypothetical protein
MQLPQEDRQPGWKQRMLLDSPAEFNRRAPGPAGMHMRFCETSPGAGSIDKIRRRWRAAAAMDGRGGKRKELLMRAVTYLKYPTMLAPALLLAACQVTPTMPVSSMSPELERVSQSLASWPKAPTGATGIKRPFFTTIHAGGRRVTASGVLDYHSARDFRMTAVTEMGVILFDGRINWAGVTVLRQMPGLDARIVESLVSDMSKAFTLPESLDGLALKDGSLVLSKTGADTNRYTWLFDPGSGRLREIAVKMGAFDTLYVRYLRYNVQGWPEEITLTRKARFYTIHLTFNDGSIVRRP